MNISHITPKFQQQNSFNNKDSNKAPQFTGAAETTATLLLRFLDTNQAIGANSVDLCSMVIPRTTYDFKKTRC